ncbi:hypothetical protein TNCV_4379661 [Trichonephila clavipes]|nr:hypothetical protein TNCV_4379661 [Trichonephila clavipes]
MPRVNQRTPQSPPDSLAPAIRALVRGGGWLASPPHWLRSCGFVGNALMMGSDSKLFSAAADQAKKILSFSRWPSRRRHHFDSECNDEFSLTPCHSLYGCVAVFTWLSWRRRTRRHRRKIRQAGRVLAKLSEIPHPGQRLAYLRRLTRIRLRNCYSKSLNGVASRSSATNATPVMAVLTAKFGTMASSISSRPSVIAIKSISDM